MPFIFGSPNIDEFLNFKNIIDLSKISYAQINNLYFFPSKRWDLELKNGTIIRLSNDNHKRSLNYAQEFLYNKELRDIKIIGARIKNQIILNDG